MSTKVNKNFLRVSLVAISFLLLVCGMNCRASLESKVQFTAEEQAEIDKFLEEHGSDVKAVDEKGRTLLHHAVGSLAVIKYLVSQGADVKAQADDRGDGIYGTPLHYAAYSTEDVGVLKFLLSQGVDVNVKDKKGSTPLHYAVYNKNAEVAKFLVANGADVCAKDGQGGIPLERAIGSGSANEAVAEYLYSLMKDTDNKQLFLSLLYAAVKFDNLDDTKSLVARGVNVNEKSWQFVGTPLSMAVEKGNVEMVEYLVSQGANVNVDGLIYQHNLFTRP